MSTTAAEPGGAWTALQPLSSSLLQTETETQALPSESCAKSAAKVTALAAPLVSRRWCRCQRQSLANQDKPRPAHVGTGQRGGKAKHLGSPYGPQPLPLRPPCPRLIPSWLPPRHLSWPPLPVRALGDGSWPRHPSSLGLSVTDLRLCLRPLSHRGLKQRPQRQDMRRASRSHYPAVEGPRRRLMDRYGTRRDSVGLTGFG
uniref:Uncharacterized protein n=1 Tax=Knipowitschia caucasica TaxID=637954 RepID=A0AAV2KH71_KNICA